MSSILIYKGVVPLPNTERPILGDLVDIEGDPEYIYIGYQHTRTWGATLLIEGYELELCEPGCVPGAAVYSAKAHIADDVSEVMPYLNAVLDRPLYGENNQFIVWEEGDRGYALRPHELAVSMILDRKQAREVLDKAIARINETWERRSEIVPDYTKKTKPGILDVLKNLPQTNCGECGLPSCMAFAAQLAEGNRQPEDCPPLLKDENSEALRGLREQGI